MEINLSLTKNFNIFPGSVKQSSLLRILYANCLGKSVTYMSRNMITFRIKSNVVVLIQTDQANFKNSKTMRKSSIAILILEQMASFRILFFTKESEKVLLK